MDRFLGEIQEGSKAPPDLNEICNFDDSGIKFTLKVEKNSKIKNPLDSGNNGENKKKLQFLIDKCNLSEGSQSTGTSGSSDNEDIEIDYDDDAKINKGGINSFISRVFGESASKLSLMLKSFSGSLRKTEVITNLMETIMKESIFSSDENIKESMNKLINILNKFNGNNTIKKNILQTEIKEAKVIVEKALSEVKKQKKGQKRQTEKVKILESTQKLLKTIEQFFLVKKN